MSRHVMLCFVMLCYVMFCCVTYMYVYIVSTWTHDINALRAAGDLGGSQAFATCAGATGAGLADCFAEEPPNGSAG